MKNNFILIRLCDNDFREELEKSAADVFGAEHFNINVDDPEDLKEWIIHAMKAYFILRYFKHSSVMEDADRIEKYLKEFLRVVLYKDRPDIDHDGGSYVYDVNLKTGYLT